MTVTVITPTIDGPNLIVARWTSAQIVTAAAIRNTSGHDATNDAAFVIVKLTEFPGAKVIFGVSTLDHDAMVGVMASFDGINVYGVGSAQTVTANSAGWIDPNNVNALAWPYPYIGVSVTCAVSPTTGSINLYLMARSV